MTDHVPTKSITAGQISKIYDVFAAALQKSDLPSELTQQVLESQGVALVDEFVESVRQRVETINNLFVRHTVVNRARSPQEAIDATRRDKHLNKNVVAMMPKGTGDEVDVIFFKLGRDISDDDLEKEYGLRGLKPVDPYALAAVNEDDQNFADEHPNSTHWKDANGRWCYAGFDCWGGVDRVVVYLNGIGWNGRWWFAGVRK